MAVQRAVSCSDSFPDSFLARFLGTMILLSVGFFLLNIRLLIALNMHRSIAITARGGTTRVIMSLAMAPPPGSFEDA